MKKLIIVVAVVLPLMFFTNPKEEKHVEKYNEKTSLLDKASGFLADGISGEYTDLFVLSLYKKGDYSSMGVFGVVFGR